MLAPSIQINSHNTYLIRSCWKPPIEEQSSAEVDNEIKEKVDELERKLKQIEEADSQGNVNFIDLCIHPGLKLSAKIKWLNFEKYDGKSCTYTHLKLSDVAIAQYGDNNILLVQTFPISLTRVAFSWFTKLKTSRIKQWIDLVHRTIKI